jgi:hypothetical protein
MLNIAHFPVNKITKNGGFWFAWRGSYRDNRRFHAKMADCRLTSRNSVSSMIAPLSGGDQAAY